MCVFRYTNGGQHYYSGALNAFIVAVAQYWWLPSVRVLKGPLRRRGWLESMTGNINTVHQSAAHTKHDREREG